jgi:hypothetical protein
MRTRQNGHVTPSHGQLTGCCLAAGGVLDGRCPGGTPGFGLVRVGGLITRAAERVVWGERRLLTKRPLITWSEFGEDATIMTLQWPPSRSNVLSNRR